MSARDDDRFGEDICVSFAMYCDTHGLTVEEGDDLACRIGDLLSITSDQRGDYVPDPFVPPDRKGSR